MKRLALIALLFAGPAAAQSPPPGSQYYTMDNSTTGTLGSLNAIAGPLQLSGEVGALLVVPSSSTLVGTITPYCSGDNATYTTTTFIIDAAGNSAATLTTASGTAYQYGIALLPGCKYTQVKATSYTSGTVTVTLTANQVPAIGNLVVVGSSSGTAAGITAASTPTAYATPVIAGGLRSEGVIGNATSPSLMQVVGGVFTTTQPTQTTGQSQAFPTTSRGEQLVALSNGALPVTVAAVNSTNATNVLHVEAARATTSPTAVTNGNGAQLQVDASNGALYMEVVPTAVAAGAPSVTTFATSTTTANVKASAGNLYGFGGISGATAGCWFQCVNSSGAGTLGTSVIFQWPLPNAGQFLVSPSDMALANFSTGIACGVASAVNGASACGTSSAVVIFYK